MRVLVLGGGVSGLYLSLLLSQQGNTFDVSLLNREHSVGGRLLSRKSNEGEILEMGAMRIPSHHRHTLDLCSELGLHLSLFNGTTLYNVVGDANDIDRGPEVELSPSILVKGILRYCRIDKDCEVPPDWLFIKLSLRLSERGIELSDLSFAELVHLVLSSKEQSRFWSEIGYDYLRFLDVSAIYALENAFTTSRRASTYYTVSSGMQSIANEMHKRINLNDVRVFTGETVMSVNRTNIGYLLKTQNGREFYSDLLVLAIPPKEIMCLNRSNPFLDKEYLAALNDIGDYASTKTYATFPAHASLIARLNGGFFTTALPIRQGHFNPCASSSVHNSQTILAEYRNLLSDHPDSTNTPSSIEEIVYCLNRLLHTRLDAPAFYSTIDWSITQSCVAAHYWKTGASPSKVIAKLQSFDSNVAFAGEAFSLGHGWVEGALASASSLVSKILHRYVN